MLSNNILTESKTARTSVVSKYNEVDAFGILDKAKALMQAGYQGTGYATTEQVAEYYEVPLKTIQSLYQRNKEEFGNEAQKLTGKELDFATFNMQVTNPLSSKTRSILLWKPKAMLRVGLLLTESIIAQAVRDIVLSLALSTEQLEQKVQELQEALNTSLSLNQKYEDAIKAILPRIEVLEQKLQQPTQPKPATNDPNFIPPGWDKAVWNELPEQDKQYFRRLHRKRSFIAGNDV